MEGRKDALRVERSARGAGGKTMASTEDRSRLLPGIGNGIRSRPRTLRNGLRSQRNCCGRGGGGGWFFFSSRGRHTGSGCNWSSDVCSSDLVNTVHASHLHTFTCHAEACVHARATACHAALHNLHERVEQWRPDGRRVERSRAPLVVRVSLTLIPCPSQGTLLSIWMSRSEERRVG